MNIQKFLSLNLKTENRLTAYPFLSEYFDIEEPNMRCLSYALVNPDQEVKGIKTVVELSNYMPHSEECPCFIDTEWMVDYPNISKNQIDGYLKENAIKFQRHIINLMIDHEYELTDVELEAISSWDKQDLLQQPDELEDVMNYIFISCKAADWMEQHMRNWLTTIVD